jgi:predicted nucleic-acid-binding protein
LQAGQGKLILFTTTLVVVESVDVLELGFAIDRRRIKEIMLGVLHSDGLEVQALEVAVQEKKKLRAKTGFHAVDHEGS